MILELRDLAELDRILTLIFFYRIRLKPLNNCKLREKRLFTSIFYRQV